MRRSWLVLLLLLLPVLAHGADFVCGDSAQLRTYLFTVDPSQVAGDCTAISKEDVAAQRAFMAANPDRRTLRVVSGLAALKDQADLDALAAADAAAQATADALAAELAANEACNATSLQDALDKINTQKALIQTDIDAVSNIATAKTALTTANNKLTAISANIARCLVVILRQRR